EPSRLGTPPTTEIPPPVLAPLSGAAALVNLGLILTLTIGFAFYPPCWPSGPHSQALQGVGVGGVGVERHRTPDRCSRLVHHARPPGLPAVLDDHGRECHRARGRGSSDPVALA